MTSLYHSLRNNIAIIGLATVVSSGCAVVDKVSPSKYDADIKARCEQLGGEMAVSQDKHGDYVHCLFPDQTHCAASVVRSTHCQPGKWPISTELQRK